MHTGTIILVGLSPLELAVIGVLCAMIAAGGVMVFALKRKVDTRGWDWTVSGSLLVGAGIGLFLFTLGYAHMKGAATIQEADALLSNPEHRIVTYGDPPVRLCIVGPSAHPAADEPPRICRDICTMKRIGRVLGDEASDALGL